MSDYERDTTLSKPSKENPMEGNGCPKCEKLAKEYYGRWGSFAFTPCIDCRIEQAEHDVLKAMSIVKGLKQEKAKLVST